MIMTEQRPLWTEILKLITWHLWSCNLTWNECNWFGKLIDNWIDCKVTTIVVNLSSICKISLAFRCLIIEGPEIYPSIFSKSPKSGQSARGTLIRPWLFQSAGYKKPFKHNLTGVPFALQCEISFFRLQFSVIKQPNREKIPSKHSFQKLLFRELEIIIEQ